MCLIYGLYFWNTAILCQKMGKIYPHQMFILNQYMHVTVFKFVVHFTPLNQIITNFALA